MEAVHRRGDLDPADPALDAIADLLGDLPLALHLAGYYLETYTDDDLGQPARYLEALQQQDISHRSLDRDDDGDSITQHAGSVARSFQLSYQRLLDDDPVNRLAQAQDLLAIAACHALGESMPRELLKQLLPEQDDEAHLADSFNRLQRELGLLTRDEQGGLVLHRLLAQFISGQIGIDQLPHDEIETRMNDWAIEINASGLPAPLRPWRMHLQHVAEVAAQNDHEQAGGLFNELGSHYREEGLYPQARAAYERALKIGEATYGPTER